MKLIECVPNFSEGNDLSKIKFITDAIESVDGIHLLDVDAGKATNRTVVTFVGTPDNIVEAAFLGIKTASEVIDMRRHKGEHPRMGATDVCPFIPLSGVSIEECVVLAKQLAKRVADELNIPIYLYESAQENEARKNLALIRSGEYEGFFKKIKLPEWKPDFGKAEMNEYSGATVIGVRNFLIAYNVNLNTKSTRLANSVAFDIRENGRVKREGNAITGKIINDENGEPVRIPGSLKECKAIGWFIEEYGQAQVSINLTDYKTTNIYHAFDECCKSAERRGMRVTGSELVGLIPLEALLEAGKFYLKKQNRSLGVSEEELIFIAVKSMGLDDLNEFIPEKKIIEYKLKSIADERLIRLTLKDFANETASESPAPGGGSIAAYAGVLGVSLAAMVANLSAGKRGWEEQINYFSDIAEKAQQLKKILLYKVDEDTRAFNKIMEAFALPKNSDEEKSARKTAIQSATKAAVEVPFSVMQHSHEALYIVEQMTEKGNPNSVSDAGVGALCIRTAVCGAMLNVKINLAGLQDENYKTNVLNSASEIENDTMKRVDEILKKVNEIIQNSK